MRHYYYKIRTFLRNCWKYHKGLSEIHPWDYQGLLVMNKMILEDMYEYQSTVDYFVSVNRDNTCKHMKVTIGHLNRLINDEYNIQNLDFGDEIPDLVKVMDLPTKKMVSKHAKSKRIADLDAVAKFWQKYLLQCWH